jgi:hypothetical protein
MKVRVFQVLYKPDGSMTPSDPELYELAKEYAAKQLSAPCDFLNYKHLWAACEVNEDDRPVRCLGLLGMALAADFPLFRFTDNVACKKLVERANDFLHDQGAAGTTALVRIDLEETGEIACPDREQWMQAFKIEPAKRWTIKVR